MSVNWTKEQLLAIETTDKNLLVSASAGSGKTAVLVERIIRLIQNKFLQTDELLAITFTKAAAGELKQRIRKAIREKIRESSDEDVIYYSQQAEKLESASISTLHSFCFSVIKKYYYLIGVDPGSRIMRDEERLIMYGECIDDICEEYYERGDSEFEEFAVTLASGRDDSDIKENIISAYDSLRNLDDYRDKLREFAENYPKDEEMFLRSSAVEFIMQKVREVLTEARQKYSDALQISASCDEKGKVTDNLAVFVENIDLLLKKLDEGFREFVICYESTVFPRALSANKLERGEEIAFYRDAGKALISDLEGLIPFDYETLLTHTLKMRPYVLKFREVTEKYEELLRSRKSENKVLDYSDLEHLCLEILKNDDAREEIKSSFKQILVDEYQDINGVQEAIIQKLASENNLFCVGDIKQSIYGFRQADPGIFAEKYERYKSGEDENNLLVHLNKNFRSVPTIIDFVNIVFSKVMFANTGGIDFYPDEMMKTDNIKEEDCPVSIRIIDCSEYQGTDMEDHKDAEAMYVANLIKNEILPTGKFTAENIAVIDRAMNSKADYFVRAFETVGLDADIRENTRYYDAFEVSLIINLLNLIDNEYNDIALLTVMRSFICNFSEDELTMIRAKNNNTMYYHQAVSEYAVSGENIRLKEKICSMYDDIRRYRYLSRHISISRLIRTIYEEKHILQFVGAMREGEKRISNLEELINIASGYEEENLKGLYDFIIYADKCKEKMQVQNSSSKKGGIKLMTTHSSKGLEFDVVIVTGCATAIRNKDHTYGITADKDFGICTKFTDTAMGYKASTLELIANKENRKDKNKAEEMRILYVAATRAKKRLYMTAAMKQYKPEKYTYTRDMGTYEISKASSYLEWIKYAVDTYPGDISEVAEILVEQPMDMLPVNTKRKGADIFDGKDAVAGYVETIRENLAYTYPYNSVAVPSKLSVSSLKDDVGMLNERIVERISIKDTFIDSADKKDITRRGNLIHKVLELIDLKDAGNNDIESIIEEMRLSGKFGFGELTSYDINMVKKFFSGDIGKMLLSADRVYREQPFILSVKAKDVNERWADSSDSILIQGIIDCYFEYDGEIYLLDFKTDRIKDDDHFAYLNEKYTKQLSYYKTAIEHSLGRKVYRTYICYLRKNIIKEVL
ncbi:MAG: helicase-exonuclease AddAB subunit AddA [Anaerofustis stercorihominis]|nr:helicase-exonuclease AddAB subunit AddA [Anaerofustis stercorihominis]